MSTEKTVELVIAEDKGATYRGAALGPVYASDGHGTLYVGEDDEKQYSLHLDEAHVRRAVPKLARLIEIWDKRDQDEKERGSVALMRESAIRNNEKLNDTAVHLVVECAAKLGYIEKTAQLVWLAMPTGCFMITIERGGRRVATGPLDGAAVMPTEPGLDGIWQVVQNVREILKGLR